MILNNKRFYTLKSIFIFIFFLFNCSKNTEIEKSIQEAIKDKNGVIVLIESSSEKKIISGFIKSKEREVPCSTFKIWNTLIGLENNIIFSSKDPFYKWDGQKRFISYWNKDLNLKEAFQVSCVPAFQILARKIGIKNMQIWLDKINYGNKDISSGIDVFWLPKEGKRSILISPEEQAILISNLITNKIPFSEKSKKILKELMRIKESSFGVLYGKTGTGLNINGRLNNNIGWFVGYIVSKNKTYSFACLIKGENVSGKEAQIIMENLFAKNKLI